MLPRRFDSLRLRPVLPAEVSARQSPGSLAVVRACRLGAGPASRPVLQPWAPPRIEWPFGVLHVADAEWARQACLLLDGTWALADAPGALARWRVRGAALAAGVAWWRPLAPQDAWDAGVAPSASALRGFVPRRATLIVIEQVTVDEAGAQALAALEQQAFSGPRAVRVLLAGGPVPPFARPVAP